MTEIERIATLIINARVSRNYFTAHVPVTVTQNLLDIYTYLSDPRDSRVNFGMDTYDDIKQDVLRCIEYYPIQLEKEIQYQLNIKEVNDLI